MDRRLIPSAVIVLALATACGGQADGDSSTPPSTSAVSAAASASAGPSGAVREASAAACNEVNRLTREVIAGLTDPSPGNWEAFAVSVQNVANGAPDPAMRDALTELATGALTASERLDAGSGVRDALVDFDAAVPALDVLCKRAGQPLN